MSASVAGAVRTRSRNGKGDAYAYCKACHPGAIERRWTRELVLAAMLQWCEHYGRLPSSYDWSRTHAQRRGKQALRRLAAGHWPAASVVSAVFGSWALAREAAAETGPPKDAHLHRTIAVPEPPDRCPSVA